MRLLRYLCLPVLLILALVAGGCTAPVAPAAPAPAAGDTADAGAATTGPSGTLTFLSWYNQEQYQPLLDAFQKAYPNVQIDFQNVPAANNQYVQRLQLLASSGELPDLFYVGPPVTLMAKNGHLADLSDLPAVKALPDGYKTYYTYDGKVYAYAPDAWVGGVFYNKKLFADNNLAEPKTWADFIAAAEVFKKAGIRPITMSADSVNDLVYWLHNTEVLSQDPNFDARINTGEATFKEGYLEALNTWKTQLVDTGYIGQDVVALERGARLVDLAHHDTGAEADQARARRRTAEEEREQRGLARPVRPDDGGDLSFLDREADAFHGGELAVGHRQVPGFEHRRHPTLPR